MNSAEEPTPWWISYFDEVFLRVYRPLMDEERTVMEVGGIIELLNLPAGSRILDVGCGWGRHSIELAIEGFEVTGLDFSPLLLQRAEADAADRGAQVRWVTGDMRKLEFQGKFDAALSLFSSLGYFEDDEEDTRVLRGMRDAVVPGGLLLIESMHRDMIAREFVERDWWETPDGDQIRVERSFDAVAGISHELLHWRDSAGNSGEKPHSVRIRSASEWADLLDRAGWRPLEWLGGWDLEPFTHLSGRLIVLAERSEAYG